MIFKAIGGITSVILLVTGITCLPTNIVKLAHNTASSQHVSYVKPGAAVELVHDYDGETQKGEIETFMLTLNHIYTEGYLTVNLLPAHDLQIYSDMYPQQIKLHTGSVFTSFIQFSSMTEGTYYLGLETVYESPDGYQSRRVLSVPIVIGSRANENFQALKSKNVQPVKRDVIVLPALEVIK